MFGTNETLPQVNEGGDVVRVQEVFSTIQGEGPLAGTPATFVRLYGCHLKCWFCDTDFSSVNEPLAVDQLAHLCQLHGNSLVVLTGGEPMRQNIVPLCTKLLAAGYRVQIETAGNLWFAWDAPLGSPALDAVIYHPNFSIVISPKTHRVDERMLDPRLNVSWKYVVAADEEFDDDDGLPVVNYQTKGGRARRLARPWFSPVAGPLPDEVRARVYVQPMDVADPEVRQKNIACAVAIVRHHKYRLSLQQHKLLGLP